MKGKKLIGVIVGIILAGVAAFFGFNNNGEEKLGYYTNQLDTYIVEKVVTSSDIGSTTALAVDLTQRATGDFLIENIIVETDSTGLATGTNFAISISGDEYGLATIWSSAVSGLGANKTVDINTASVAKQRAILEDGSKLIGICTTASCEGAGKAKVTVILKKLDSYSSIFD